MAAVRTLYVILLVVLAKLLSAQRSLPVESFTVFPPVHIRALEVINDSTAWFGASRGVWGYTANGGKTWHVDSIKVDSIVPQFRSIAVLNDSTVLLLGIASPAYLMKTTNRGRSWRVVYKNDHPSIFFDCMLFQDANNGIAIGDPIGGCFQIIETADSGETWKQKSCAGLPPAQAGEACFATSNSNLDISGNSRWFVTGGKKSRLFRSTDKGRHYEPFDVPLPEGETMTGIFSFDFFDEQLGVIAGGNYERTDTTVLSLALTRDGGKTWRPLRTAKPFFGSCIRFMNRNEVLVTGHNGTFHVNLRFGKCSEITNGLGETLKYYTLRFSPREKVLWMAGPSGKLARVKMGKFPE